MSSLNGPDAGWSLFLSEGETLSSALRDTLSTPPDLPAALEAATALELDALVVGVQEIARGATALRVALEGARGEVAPGAMDLVQALLEAYAMLSLPDRSGAQIDGRRIDAAIALLGSAPRRAAPPPAMRAAQLSAPIRSASAADDDTRWVPQVDEDMIDPFLEECQERLEGLAEKLVELERAADDPELLRALFRDLHTLKGSSAFVGLRRMTRVAHAAEDIVGNVRDGKRAIDRPLIDSLLAAVDVLGAIVQRAAARAPIDVEVEAIIARLLGRDAPDAPSAPTRSAPAQTPTASSSAAHDADAAPGPSAKAAAVAAQDAAKQTLRIDFDKLDLLMNLVGELVLAKGRLGGSVEGLGSLGRELDVQRKHASAAMRAKASSALRGGIRSQDLGTELSRVQRAFDQLTQEIDGASQQLDFVSGELRDQVMKLRMVPIGRAWQKYHRTVREVARSLGKQVRLELVGGETELDKVLVEQLDDPFMHLVRNAVDHGVEAPADRVQKGKNAEGVLRFGAKHRGNQIVVTIEDDGAGINTARVREKAIEQGLVTPEQAAHLEDTQIFDLIFRPGFSTAKTVSDVSGRGVGMDVVRETISRLKGTVSVQSNPGGGTRFEIRLPLTLAIIQVLLVRCAGQTLAIPIDLVTRSIAAPASDVRVVVDREVLHDGERDVPLVRLRDALGLVGSDGAPDLVPVVFVDLGGQVWGLACDGFLGRQEIVLKTLGSLLARVPGAAGATLVGDSPVLILDVPTLIGMVQSGALRRPAPTAPRERRAVGRDATAKPAQSTGSARVQILVAEDADVVREMMRRTLETAGYAVTVARDGEEALALAERTHFALVSTDVVMPRVDGYEVTRRLRATDAYRDVPIVMVTSKDERIDRLRGFDAGVDAYLAKPVDPGELLRVVERQLAHSVRPPKAE